MARPHVYVTRRLPSPGVELVKEHCDVVLHQGEGPPTKDEIVKNVRDKDALLCLITDRIDRDIIAAGQNLRVISTMSVGFEHIDVSEATRRGIYLGYTPEVLTDATADLAFTLIMCVARKIVEADKYLRTGNWKIPWSPTMFLGEDVWGMTIGIIGLGRIGRAVAKRAKGFNMKILYADSVRAPIEIEMELGVEYCSLEELLKRSDFITVHVPLMEPTRHLINEKNLRLMKPSAFLINTSRGPTVDENALIRALDEKWIAGAGLDVFEKEPIDMSSPLITMDNVTLVPHIASATKQSRSKMAENAARNLLAVLKGKPPRFWVNPEVEKIRSLSQVKMI